MPLEIVVAIEVVVVLVKIISPQYKKVPEQIKQHYMLLNLPLRSTAFLCRVGSTSLPRHTETGKLTAINGIKRMPVSCQYHTVVCILCSNAASA